MKLIARLKNFFLKDSEIRKLREEMHLQAQQIAWMTGILSGDGLLNQLKYKCSYLETYSAVTNKVAHDTQRSFHAFKDEVVSSLDKITNILDKLASAREDATKAMEDYMKTGNETRKILTERINSVKTHQEIHERRFEKNDNMISNAFSRIVKLETAHKKETPKKNLRIKA